MLMVTPDVPIPLLMPSVRVHFVNEVVAGSLINFLGQERNTFFVDGRGESAHKPLTLSCQLPLAVMRLLPPLIVVSACLRVAAPPAHFHPPDRPNQGLTKQQARSLHYYK